MSDSKRYQVFVSSTYADLREERRRIIQTLMEMDCIPSGMELFPAADEEQWEFIKRVIDDCDYYLLIVGGRYGSVTTEGISYTEKEYDYAIERGIKVVAFLHEKPDDIPVGKSDIDPELRKRLEAFREKVAKNRLVRFWKSPEELPGLVALSLSKTMKTYPAVGWIRADQASNPQLLGEVNELRKRNSDLEKQLAQHQKHKKIVPNLASLDERFTVSGTYTGGSWRTDWEVKISWKELFSLIAPYLLQHPSEDYVKLILGRALLQKSGKQGTDVKINDQTFQTIKIQFLALNLVSIDYLQTVSKSMALFWSLTKEGQVLMISLRSVKSAGRI